MTASTTQNRPLPDGVYVPTVAFFKDDDEVDLEATQRHAIQLADAGVAGIVVQGSRPRLHPLRYLRHLIQCRAQQCP